jgi:hypothetical protein
MSSSNMNMGEEENDVQLAEDLELLRPIDWISPDSDVMNTDYLEHDIQRSEDFETILPRIIFGRARRILLSKL